MTTERPITIHVDADACPVKAEVYKVAERCGLAVTVVSNRPIGIPRDGSVRFVLVGEGPDAADDWIAGAVQPADIVVTSDIPLAGRCLKAGALVVTPTGREMTEASIGMALATRDLMQDLRSAGAVTGGPKPFEARDRSAFLGALDRMVTRARRLQAHAVTAAPPPSASGGARPDGDA